MIITVLPCALLDIYLNLAIDKSVQLHVVQVLQWRKLCGPACAGRGLHGARVPGQRQAGLLQDAGLRPPLRRHRRREPLPSLSQGL